MRISKQELFARFSLSELGKIKGSALDDVRGFLLYLDFVGSIDFNDLRIKEGLDACETALIINADRRKEIEK